MNIDAMIAPGRAFDVRPDGQAFVMVMQGVTAGHPDELVIVQNFFEELKAKATTHKR